MPLANLGERIRSAICRKFPRQNFAITELSRVACGGRCASIMSLMPPIVRASTAGPVTVALDLLDSKRAVGNQVRELLCK